MYVYICKNHKYSMSIIIFISFWVFFFFCHLLSLTLIFISWSFFLSLFSQDGGGTNVPTQQMLTISQQLFHRKLFISSPPQGPHPSVEKLTAVESSQQQSLARTFERSRFLLTPRLSLHVYLTIFLCICVQCCFIIKQRHF